MAYKKPKAKSHWYTFTSNNDGTYNATKFNIDGEPDGQYGLNAQGSYCNCPAQVPYCRHKAMLTKFKELKRIDTGWSFNPDYDEWKEPVVISDLEM